MTFAAEASGKEEEEEGGIPWHRGWAGTGTARERGLAFGNPSGGRNGPGDPGKSPWGCSVEIPPMPVKSQLGAGEGGNYSRGIMAGTVWIFEEGDGDKCLGDDWHGGSGEINGQGQLRGSGENREKGKEGTGKKGQREDGGQGAAETLQSLRG